MQVIKGGGKSNDRRAQVQTLQGIPTIVGVSDVSTMSAEEIFWGAKLIIEAQLAGVGHALNVKSLKRGGEGN